MPLVTEIAPDIFRVSTYVSGIDLQFNQFLVRDEQPLLFHTGMRSIFPEVREAVASIIDPTTLRWIGFSHFEADECGSLNEWLALAPTAEPVCSFVGAEVSVNDFAIRRARPMVHDEVMSTGKNRFRFCRTPHVPHCWEAGLMFAEIHRTLLCSDLFHHAGDVEPLTESDLVGRARQTLVQYQAGPFADYMPYTENTGPIINGLADLKPKTIATMHGSTFVGDGERALRDLALMMRETLLARSPGPG
jgi:flavorubredoxin